MLQGLAEVVTPVHLGDRQNVDLLDTLQQLPPRTSSSSVSGSGSGSAATAQSVLFLSVQWARAAYTDLVHSLLTLLSAPLIVGQQKPTSSSASGSGGGVTVLHCILLPFVTFVAQYLQAMFGKTDAKPRFVALTTFCCTCVLCFI